MKRGVMRVLFLLGMVLMLSGAATLAAPQHTSHAEFDLRAWGTVQGIFGVLCAVAAWLIKQSFADIRRRLSDTEQEVKALNSSLLGEYHTKPELTAIVESALEPVRVDVKHARDATDRTERQVDRLHRRLDAAAFPPRASRPNYADEE